MTATSDLIESLISYSWDDWQVTRQEARRVIAAIRNDNVPDATIAALDKSGSLLPASRLAASFHAFILSSPPWLRGLRYLTRWPGLAPLSGLSR